MIASYRDPRYAASLRLEHLRERFHGRSEDIPAEILDIHVRRAARSWAGGVASAGFVAVAFTSLLQAVDNHWDREGGVHPTMVLMIAVGLSFAAYVVACFVARWSFPRRVWASFDAGADELSRLARYEGDGVRRAAVSLVDRGERSSLWLPIAGVGLLVPLSLHLVIWALVGGVGSREWMKNFDIWIGLSLVLVGLAHLAIAGLGFYFAAKIRKMSLAQLVAKSPVGGWAALGITVAVSLVPGVIAIAIPPILVLVTGLPVIPWLFSHMHKSAVAERHALDML